MLDTNASLTAAITMYEAAGYSPTEQYNDNPDEAPATALILATERLGGRPELALTADHHAQIEVPALLVFAADDPMGAAAVGERVADAMADAELHVVEGGHAPWLHHADQITQTVSGFLDRV